MTRTDGDSLGVIGVGGLAGFMLEGLRRSGDRRRLYLSPRNAAAAADLAERLDGRVCDSNRQVADLADIILLSVPPAQVMPTLESVRFRPDQCVIVPAIDVNRDAMMQAAPGARIIRAMPSSCAAHNGGAMPIWPDDAQARLLLARLGAVFAVESEAEFETASALAGYYLWTYRLMDAVAEQAISHGLRPEIARGLTAALTEGAAQRATMRADRPLRDSYDEFALPGTMTAGAFSPVEEADALQPWRQAIDLAVRRMRGS